MIKTIVTAIILIAALACAQDKRIVLEGKHTIHPILNMQVVDIPSKGKVYLVESEAKIKKRDSAGYSDVVFDLLVESGDILWLIEGAKVGIKFDDGSYILNEPQKDDTFITFDLIDPQKE